MDLLRLQQKQVGCLMNTISWLLTPFFQNREKEPSEKSIIQFNKTVKGIEICRTPMDSFYQRFDYIRFKEESKVNLDDSMETPELSETDENGSDTTLITKIVKLIEKIFKRALRYLYQFFGSTPAPRSSYLEKDLSPIDSSPPRKKARVRDRDPEENLWLLTQSSPRLLEMENDCILIQKSILKSATETNYPSDTNLEENTKNNSTVTKTTQRLKQNFAKKRALIDIDTV
jgi:hypothetical protein